MGRKRTCDERIPALFTSGPYYRRAAKAFIHSSMDDREPLSRLTEREKVCLRQWLQHKSAKEIAADLGISHHAVEKRLKMARTKLGATSSLEAARMLGEAEGYGQAVTQSPDLVSDARPLHSAFTRLAVLGVAIMILVGAIVLGLLLQPAAFSQAANNQPAGPPGEQPYHPRLGADRRHRGCLAKACRRAGERLARLRQALSAVRRSRPPGPAHDTSHVQLDGRAEVGDFPRARREGDDVYDLVFANGGVIMSAALDADGRMAGGILRPLGRLENAVHPRSVPTAGTEAALRSLVAGLASGSPDYDKLSPQFAEVVRRDLPMTHRHVQLDGRAEVGDFPRARPEGRRRLRPGVRQRRGDNVGRARRRRQDGRRHSPTGGAPGR